MEKVYAKKNAMIFPMSIIKQLSSISVLSIDEFYSLLITSKDLEAICSLPTLKALVLREVDLNFSYIPHSCIIEYIELNITIKLYS